MTAASPEYLRLVMDLLAPAGAVRTRRFFGGTGLILDGVQFAMIMGNSLYFCVDDETRPGFREAGCQPFSYATRKKRVTVERYWSAPAEDFEDEGALVDRAGQALAVARRGARRGARAKAS